MARSLKEIEADFTFEPPPEKVIRENVKENKNTVASDIVFYLGLLLMVGCAVLFARGGMGEQAIGDYRMYEVLTTSMESVYPRGSLVFIKRVEPRELVVGDDITFPRDNENLVTHRIIEIIENHSGSGRRAFVTKGVDNAAADRDVVLSEQVLGKVVHGIPRIGGWLSWVGSNLWSLLLLFFSFMLASFLIRVFVNRDGKAFGEKDE